MWRLAIVAALGSFLVPASTLLAGDAAYPGFNGRIVFVRAAPGPSASGVPLRSHALYTIRPDGTDERLLVDVGGLDPSWSPDGANVVFSSDMDPSNSSIDDRELVLVPAEGSALKQLTFDSSAEASPTWSPDGSQIAFARGGAIWKMRADGTRERMVVEDALSVAWSPDGRWLTLTRGNGSIEVVHPDGTGRRRLARAAHYGDKLGFGEAVAWTPDGRIVFVNDHGLTTMTADGKARRRVSKRFNGGYKPAWSPDGRWVAFQSRTFDRLEMLSADGTRVRLLTRSAAPVHDSYPDWQPACTRRGGDGPDTVAGTTGADLLCGLGGRDRLDGRAGLDRLFGGIGDDVIDSRDGEFDIVGCGFGVDKALVDAVDRVGLDCERVRR